MGKREDITCINAFVTETPLETQIDDYAASLGEEDQVLVITDAFFGSVNQKIMGKQLKNSLIVTGANLPLVLELVTLLDRDAPITADQLKNTVALARRSSLWLWKWKTPSIPQMTLISKIRRYRYDSKIKLMTDFCTAR